MKPRILLIDDDKHLLLTLGDFLSFHNFEVTTARNAERALDILSTLTPHIILLDIGMPGLGGIGFLTELRKRKRIARLPVLILTARSTMQEFFDSVEVDGFLAKPCDQKELLSEIKEILTRRHAEAAERLKPSRTVLLVEDDYAVIEELQDAFNAGPRDLKLEIATTAADALEKVSSTNPDLILSKEVLRGMNGDEMAALLRSMPRAHSLPVVLYDKTHLFEGMREYRYRVYGRVKKFIGAPDGHTIYNTTCKILDDNET